MARKITDPKKMRDNLKYERAYCILPKGNMTQYNIFKGFNNCIYKITSPSGKVYIGQSKNLLERIRQYNALKFKPQRKLYNSIVKYGLKNHLVEVLNYDIGKDCIDIVESIYIDKYNAVDSGLNICRIGRSARGVKRTEETKKKMSESQKGRKGLIGYRHSEESKRNMSIGAKKRGIPKEQLLVMQKNRKIPKWSDEKKEAYRIMIADNHPFKGKKHSEESKLKMSYTKISNKIYKLIAFMIIIGNEKNYGS